MTLTDKTIITDKAKDSICNQGIDKYLFAGAFQPIKIVVSPAVNRGNAKNLRNLGNKRKKEKNDSESRKIYSIVSAVGAVVTVVAVIILFTHLYGLQSI